MKELVNKLSALFRPQSREAPRVVMYTRSHCHLCDEAKRLLQELQARERFEIQLIDIDSDAQLKSIYNDDVPVVFINGRKAFKHRVDAQKFLKSLRSDRAGK